MADKRESFSELSRKMRSAKRALGFGPKDIHLPPDAASPVGDIQNMGIVQRLQAAGKSAARKQALIDKMKEKESK